MSLVVDIVHVYIYDRYFAKTSIYTNAAFIVFFAIQYSSIFQYDATRTFFSSHSNHHRALATLEM